MERGNDDAIFVYLFEPNVLHDVLMMMQFTLVAVILRMQLNHVCSAETWPLDPQCQPQVLTSSPR